MNNYRFSCRGHLALWSGLVTQLAKEETSTSKLVLKTTSPWLVYGSGTSGVEEAPFGAALPRGAVQSLTPEIKLIIVRLSSETNIESCLKETGCRVEGALVFIITHFGSRRLLAVDLWLVHSK